ncbi:MAG: GAF domain-containing protein, partial [Archangium sp.]|nr:GAF domain-containing protein [Archangium sp.]
MHAPEADTAIVAPLRDGGVLDAAALEKGRAYVRQNGGLLGDALLRLNLVREPEFLRVFADHHGARSMRASGLRALKLDPSLLDRLGVRTAERLRACPIRWDEGTQELHVVAAIPLAEGLENEVRTLSHARSVAVYVASPGAVSGLVRKAYYGESDAFDRVTANGAGPAMPSAPTNLFDEDEITGSATHAMPALPSTRGEGKTVMVDLEALTIASLRQENARYRIAQEFHRRVSLERSLEAMIDRILSVIFELTQADGAAIWLNTGQFSSKLKSGDPKPLEVSRTIIDQALVAPSGLLTHNALIDDRFDRSKSVMIRGVRSVMAVAIRTRNGTLGVLYVESTSMSAAFTDEDLSMLDAIAAQAAMLLDNAALVARVKQEVEHRVGLSRFLSPAAVEEVLSG